MGIQQDEILAKRLEINYNNIIKDFNQVLEKYEFQETTVVSFTVKEVRTIPKNKPPVIEGNLPDLNNVENHSTSRIILITVCDENGVCKDL